MGHGFDRIGHAPTQPSPEPRTSSRPRCRPCPVPQVLRQREVLQEEFQAPHGRSRAARSEHEPEPEASLSRSWRSAQVGRRRAPAQPVPVSLATAARIDAKPGKPQGGVHAAARSTIATCACASRLRSKPVRAAPRDRGARRVPRNRSPRSKTLARQLPSRRRSLIQWGIFDEDPDHSLDRTVGARARRRDGRRRVALAASPLPARAETER